MLTNVNTILQKADIKYFELFHINKDDVRNALRERTIEPELRANIVMELLDIKDNQLSCGLDQNEVSVMLKHISTIR